jgi:hypothetical protein
MQFAPGWLNPHRSAFWSVKAETKSAAGMAPDHGNQEVEVKA